MLKAKKHCRESCWERREKANTINHQATGVLLMFPVQAELLPVLQELRSPLKLPIKHSAAFKSSLHAQPNLFTAKGCPARHFHQNVPFSIV